MDKELIFMHLLCPNSIILKGNVFNQIGSNDCKITDECYCHPIRFFTPALLKSTELSIPAEMLKHLESLKIDTTREFLQINENVSSWKKWKEEEERSIRQENALTKFKGRPNR